MGVELRPPSGKTLDSYLMSVCIQTLCLCFVHYFYYRVVEERGLYLSGRLVMAVEIRIAVTVMVILTAYTHCLYQVLLKTAMYHGKIISLHVVVYCLVTFFYV